MKFQITEEHLDKAIESEGLISKCRGCILAQAIKDHIKKHVTKINIPVYVYKFGIEVGEQSCDHTEETNEIMEMFDNTYYDSIMAKLPLELEIPII